MDMEFAAFRHDGAEEGEPLRALDWTGLVARLGAERDLRRELTHRVGAPGIGRASFAGGAAWAIDRSARGEAAINPDGLALRKAAQGMTPEAGAQAPDSEARGQQ